MAGDKKTALDKKESRELIKDEVADLLPLYSLDNPTKEDIKEALEEHFAKFGRVGFNFSADEEAVEIFYTHFTKNPREYLEKELSFIQNLFKGGLATITEEGYGRAKALLPQEDYEKPQTVFVLNGPRTDAKVTGKGQFGINLQNIFSKVYSKGSNTWILNLFAHEGIHVFLGQIENTGKRSTNWLVNIAFEEGLATFAETGFQFPWSGDYLKDSQFWLEIIKQAATANSEEARINLLKRINDNEALKKYNPEALERTRQTIAKGNMTTKDFEAVLQDLLIRKNGPLYYAGYAVWRKIQASKGVDGLRRVVKQGPKAFEAYI